MPDVGAWFSVASTGGPANLCENAQAYRKQDHHYPLINGLTGGCRPKVSRPGNLRIVAEGNKQPDSNPKGPKNQRDPCRDGSDPSEEQCHLLFEGARYTTAVLPSTQRQGVALEAVVMHHCGKYERINFVGER